jgi:hypothetical protein
MLAQLLVAAAATMGTIAVHAMVMTAVIRAAQAMSAKPVKREWLYLIGVMTIVVAILMGAHILEVLIWAAFYGLVDIAPQGTNLVYFAFVNYTTLGYGDVVPAPGWQLLGPITAMNGVLMFGWSTAVIFEVLRRALLRISHLDS